MRSSTILASLGAVLAVASPINKLVQKKDIVYDITTEIVYVTVTAGAPESTPPPVPVVTIWTTVNAPNTHKHKATSSSVYVAPPPPKSTPPPPPPPAPTTTSTPPAPEPTTQAAPVAESSAVNHQLASSAAAAPVPVPSATDYVSTALFHHNKHRANHSAPALVWDDTLAAYSLATAQKCVFAHDMTEGSAGYGQNLAAYGTTGDLNSLNHANLVADAITNQWYYGEAAAVPYGQDNPQVENVPEFLHFTALIWKTSTTVGCATVECPAGSIFPYHSLYTVCDYKGEGNVLGAFASNVLKPMGLPGITALIA